jgi:hypothetical protein
MKTSRLPPVHVEPAARAEIESELRDGESLSEFVEAAAEFLARGRASLAKAKSSGEFYAMDDALDQMRTRVAKKMSELRRKPAAAKKK